MVSLTLKQIEELALRLPIEQRQELIDRLSHSVTDAVATERKPLDLAGDWRGRFPDDFDVDAALREVRTQWNQDDAA